MPRSVIASVVIAALAATLLAGCGTVRDGLEVVQALTPAEAPVTDGVAVDPTGLSAACPEEVMQRYVDNGLYPVNDLSSVSGDEITAVLSSAGFDCVLSIFSAEDLEAFGRTSLEAQDISAFLIDPTEESSAQVVAALEAAGFASLTQNAWQVEGSTLAAMFVTRASYETEPLTFKIDDLDHDYSVAFFFDKE